MSKKIKGIISKVKEKLFVCQVLFMGWLFSIERVVAAKTTTDKITAEDMSESLEKITDWVSGILIVCAVIGVCIYAALPHIMGGEEGAAKGKKALKNIAFGLILGALAAKFVPTFYGFFN